MDCINVPPQKDPIIKAKALDMKQDMLREVVDIKKPGRECTLDLDQGSPRSKTTVDVPTPNMSQAKLWLARQTRTC